MLRGFVRWLRVVACAALISAATLAHAELSCDQVIASATAGIALRDQGATLRQVLAEIEKPELRQQFQPDELGVLRQALRLTYTGEVSVHELAQSCPAKDRAGATRP